MYRYRLAEPLLPPLSEYLEGLKRIWKTRYVTSGYYKQKVEEELRSILGVSNVVLLSTGTDALELTLRALRLTHSLRNTLIILPNYTYIATLNAVIRAGFKPVLIDVSPDTWTLSPEQLERALKDIEASVVLTVDVFGVPSHYEELNELCERYGAILVADSSEAFGAEYLGKPLGKQALVHIFSFSPTKLVTAGEGGAVATEDDELAETIRCLASHGLSQNCPSKLRLEGTNARLSEMNALLLHLGLKCFREVFKVRASQQELYRQALSVHGFSFQEPPANSLPSPTYTVAKLSRSTTEIVDALRGKGIEVKRYFPPLSHLAGLEPLYDTPVTRELYETTVALPTGHHLSLDDVNIIIGELLREIKGAL